MSNKQQDTDAAPAISLETAVLGADAAEKSSATKKYPVIVPAEKFPAFCEVTGCKVRGDKAANVGKLLVAIAAVANAELGSAKLAELIQKHAALVTKAKGMLSEKKDK